MKTLWLLLLVFISPAVFAQSNYAVLSGTVTDPQNRPLVGATVQLVSLSTQVTRQVTSNDHGLFQITGLLPGDYELNVRAQGFASVKQNLRLEVGQQLTLDVNLKLAAVNTTIEVGAVVDVMRTTDSSVGEVIEPAAIRDLPLNGRMLIDL